MNGEIKKIDGNWVISYKDKIYPLHPDDLQQILEDSQIFDNIEARIFAQPQVKFELTKKHFSDKTIIHAKILKQWQKN